MANLKPKEKDFINYYSSKDSPSYSKKGMSASLAYPELRQPNQKANDLLKKPEIIESIESHLTSQRFGKYDRADLLKSIAHQQHETVVKSFDSDNNLISTQTRTPTSAEVIKSIETANKMTGLYEEQASEISIKESAFKHWLKLKGKDLLK
jgi:hypothetical protein